MCNLFNDISGFRLLDDSIPKKKKKSKTNQSGKGISTFIFIKHKETTTLFILKSEKINVVQIKATNKQKNKFAKQDYHHQAKSIFKQTKNENNR